MALPMTLGPVEQTLPMDIDRQGLRAAADYEIANSSQFNRGWNAAGVGENASALMSKALWARRNGDDTNAALYEQQARDMHAQGQQWAPTVQNMTDVNSVGSAVDWAGGALGNLRSSAMPALGGLAGAAIGGLAGAVTPLPGGAAVGARYGAGLGAGLMGGKTEYDEAVSGAMMDPGIRATRSYDDIHNAALVKGGINAALESLVPMGMTKSLMGIAGKEALKKVAEQGVGKTVAKAVGTNMLEEGATEGTQSLVGQGAENWLKQKDITDFDYKQALNEAAAGAVAGGGMGAVGAAGDVAHSKLSKGVDNVKEIKSDPLGAVLDAGVDLAAKAGTAKAKLENYFDERELKKAGLTQDEIDQGRLAQIQATLAGKSDLKSTSPFTEEENAMDAPSFTAHHENKLKEDAATILKAGRDSTEAEKSLAAQYASGGIDSVEFQTRLHQTQSDKVAEKETDALLTGLGQKSKKSEMRPSDRMYLESELLKPDNEKKIGTLADIMVKQGIDERLIKTTNGEHNKIQLAGMLNWIKDGMQDHQEAVGAIVGRFGEGSAAMFKKAYGLATRNGIVKDEPKVAQDIETLIKFASNKDQIVKSALKNNLSDIALHGVKDVDAVVAKLAPMMKTVVQEGMSPKVKQGLIDNFFGTEERLHRVMNAYIDTGEHKKQVSKATGGGKDEVEIDADGNVVPEQQFDEDGEQIVDKFGAGASVSEIKGPTIVGFTNPKGRVGIPFNLGFDKGIEKFEKVKAQHSSEMGNSVTEAGIWSRTKADLGNDAAAIEQAGYDLLESFGPKLMPEGKYASLIKGFSEGTIDIGDLSPRQRAVLLGRINRQFKYLEVTRPDSGDSKHNIQDVDSFKWNPNNAKPDTFTAQKGIIFLEREGSKGVSNFPVKTIALFNQGLLTEKDGTNGATLEGKRRGALGTSDLVMSGLTDLILAEGGNFTGRIGYRTKEGAPLQWIEKAERDGNVKLERLPNELMLGQYHTVADAKEQADIERREEKSTDAGINYAENHKERVKALLELANRESTSDKFAYMIHSTMKKGAPAILQLYRQLRDQWQGSPDGFGGTPVLADKDAQAEVRRKSQKEGVPAPSEAQGRIEAEDGNVEEVHRGTDGARVGYGADAVGAGYEGPASTRSRTGTKADPARKVKREGGDQLAARDWVVGLLQKGVPAFNAAMRKVALDQAVNDRVDVGFNALMGMSEQGIAEHILGDKTKLKEAATIIARAIEVRGDKYVVRNAGGKTETRGRGDAVAGLGAKEVRATSDQQGGATRPDVGASAQSGTSGGKQSEVSVKESSASGYAERTKHNANSADVTIAFAIDHGTAGERLTARLAGNKLVKFESSLKEFAEAIIAKLKSVNGTSINVAGNGIYTWAKSGGTQEAINQRMYKVLKMVKEQHPALNKIVTGGQTGSDIAGAIAAKALGIPVEVTMPKGFLQRGVDGKDFTQTQAAVLKQIEDGAAALGGKQSTQLTKNSLHNALGETNLPENLTNRMSGVFDGSSKMVDNPNAPSVKELLEWVVKNVKGLDGDNSLMAIVDSILASPVANLPVVSEALLGTDGKNVVGRYTRTENADAKAGAVRRLSLDDTHGLTAETLLHEVTHAWAVVSLNDPIGKQKFVERYINEIFKEAVKAFEKQGSPSNVSYAMTDAHELASEFSGNKEVREFLSSVATSPSLKLKKKVIESFRTGEDSVGKTLKALMFGDVKVSNDLASELSSALTELVAIPADFRYSKQQPNANPKSKEEFDASVAQAVAHILFTLGKNVKLDLEKMTGASGSWTPGQLKNTIKLALNGDVLGAAFHESFHEFVDILKKNGAKASVEVMQRAAMNPIIQRKLERLLDGHPEAIKQLAEPEEAAAFMYQFWMAGALKVGPETRTVFQKIKDMLKRVAGMFSETFRTEVEAMTREQLEAGHAELLMRQFSEGAVANAATRQAVVDGINKDTELHNAAVERVGETFQTFANTAGKMVFSAEAMMDATGNKHMVEIMRDMHQKVGTAMRKVGKSTGSYSDGLRQATSQWVHKVESLLEGYSEEDLELAREAMSKEVEPTDRVAKEIVAKINKFYAEMAGYMAEKGVKRLNLDRIDPATGMKGVWEDIPLRKNYLSQVWSIDTLMAKMPEFKADLLKHHMKELEAIAAEANKELKNMKGVKNGTAAGIELERADKEFKDSDKVIAKLNLQTITPEMVADAIGMRLLASNGHIEISETNSGLGITPAASAVNKRELNWLDKEVFDKYKEKNLTEILTTYAHSIVKRGEYQSRFGPAGEKIADGADKAVLHELGGDKLVDKAVDQLPNYISEWKKAKASAKGDFDEPFPTLRSVGQWLHLRDVGQDKHEAAMLKAMKKLENGFNAIQALEGTLGRDISPNARALNSWLVTYQSFRTLSTMLFTSFQDVAGIVVNGGEAKDAWNAFVEGVREIRNTVFDHKNPSAAILDSEFWGTVDSGAYLESTAQAQGSPFMSGKAKVWSDKFFKYTGAVGWNRGVRAVATQVAERIIIGWKTNGIDRSDKAAVARLEDLFGKDFDPANIKLDADGRLDKNDQANQAAITRWVLTAVPAPTAAHRTIWMSDPHWAVFAQLKNYTYSFHRIMMKNAADQARLGNYRPALAMMAGYIPIAIAAGAVKEMLIPGDEPPWMKGGLDGYLSYGFSRAGVLGVPQMMLGSIVDVSQLPGGNFGKAGSSFDPAGLAGPTVDQVQNILSIPFGEFMAMRDHTVIGEGFGALPGGSLLKRLERLGNAGA